MCPLLDANKTFSHGYTDETPAIIMEVGDFKIGWICVLAHELTAARAILDEEYPPLSGIPNADDSHYTLGRIGPHNIVIVCLPIGRYGNSSAAKITTNLQRTFPRISYGILVGVGGGVPTQDHDIRLGDVVVAVPQGTSAGVIQYEMGKRSATSFQRKGSLGFPPMKLLNAVQALKSQMEFPRRDQKSLHELLEKALDLEIPTLKYPDDRHSSDVLSTSGSIVTRDTRSNKDPVIHYGLVGSGDSFMASEAERDRLHNQDGIICFEMEAAGVLHVMPCLVVRGVGNYANAQKTDAWHGYAALTAACYAKMLLLQVAGDPAGSSAGTRSWRHEVQFRPQPIPKTQMPSAVADFTGRNSELNTLSFWIEKHQQATFDYKACVIVGMGGIGKTQLALKAVAMYGCRYKQALWFDGSTELTLQTGLKDLQPSLDSSLSNTDFSVTLDQPELEGSLMIIENVDLDWRATRRSPEAYNVEKYLPSNKKSFVIITSRLASWSSAFKCLALLPLQNKDAHSILEKSAGQILKRK